MENQVIEFTRTSTLTGKTSTMMLNVSEFTFAEGARMYNEGALLQDAFHFLTPAEREFVKTGITPEEWDAHFGSEEETE